LIFATLGSTSAFGFSAFFAVFLLIPFFPTAATSSIISYFFSSIGA